MKIKKKSCPALATPKEQSATPLLSQSKGDHWYYLHPETSPKVFQQAGARLLTIDPGISGTGWALWEGHDFYHPAKLAPIACGVIIPKKGAGWGDAARDLNERLYNVFRLGGRNNPVQWIAAEWPNFRATATGAAVAASGDLGKLYFAASLPLALGLFMACDCTPVSVMEWKGQLSKELVQQRIVKRLGSKTCEALAITSHAWDAVGIGLYLKGAF